MARTTPFFLDMSQTADRDHTSAAGELGFTLVEMLLAVLVLAVLSAIVVRTVTRTATTPDRSRPEGGQSLVALVVVLAVLGGMAAIVVSKVGTSNGVNPEQLPALNLPGSLPASTTATASKPSSNGVASTSDITAAAAVACRTDYEAVAQAASEYQALYGQRPASMAELQSFLKDPLTSAYFTITIDPHVPGSIEVATPGHPAQAGDSNCEYAR